MPGENVTNFALGIINALILLVSVLILSLTFRDNKKFHKQRLMYDILSHERELKTKLDNIVDKIEKTNSREREEELWNDYDTLLFSFYESLGVLIFKGIVDESYLKNYFQPLLRNVYEIFYYDTEIFDQKGPFRGDYIYIQKLFKRWEMKTICDQLFSRDR